MTQKNFTTTVIVGGKLSGKTSVAMRLALDSAASGHFSLVIGNREKVEQLFKPTVAPVFSTTCNFVSLLSNIQLSYADQKDSIIEIMAGVQFFKNTPTLIVVEDLSTLVDPLHTRSRNDVEYLQQVLLIISHLQDLASALPCGDSVIQLVITDCCEDESEYVALLNHCADHKVHVRIDRATCAPECRDNDGKLVEYDTLKALIGLACE